MFTAISKTNHKNFGYASDSPFSFAKNDMVVEVSDQEISKLINTLPLGFIQIEESYKLVTICSLIQGQNWLVAPNGKWLARYVPALLRAYPFALVNQQENNSVLCVREQAEGFKAGNGEAILDASGELTDKGQGLMKFLGQLNQSLINTNQKVAELNEAGLIDEWSFDIATQTGKQPFKGLYKVNEQALVSLEPEALSKLAKTGALALAYGQLYSMNSLSVLSQYAQAQTQFNKQQQQVAEALKTDSSDDLEFDFGA